MPARNSEVPQRGAADALAVPCAAALLPDEAAAALLRILGGKGGFVALTGPAGSGKTAVLDQVAARLAGDGVAVLRLDHEGAKGGGLSLRGIIAQIGGRPGGVAEEGGAAAAEGAAEVEVLLEALSGGEGRRVVMVDDAHALQRDAVEFFRLFSILGRGGTGRARVLFAGQPGFWDIFNDEAGGPRGRLVRERLVLAERVAAPVVAAPVAAEVVEPAPEVAEPAAALELVPVREPGRARRRAMPVLGAALVGGLAGAAAMAWYLERDPPAALVVTESVAAAAAPEPPIPERPIPERPVPEPPVAEVSPMGSVALPTDPDAQHEAVAVLPVVMASRVVDPVLLAAVEARGEALLRAGDISGARLAYGLAAEAGSAVAATALGRTHDPGFLATIGARGIVGDVGQAVAWYRRAVALGDVDAGVPLQRLDPEGE